ncbi:MAG TPA: radical SAM protein [Thermoleophilia bacterium]|nr:radical SAM protein [Thermoleophilia bacterium]
MRVKMISPAKTAADSVFWRSIKYSLFPPLGLATLAGYLDPDDEVDLQDEHVEKLCLDDEPDLVVIEAYITSAGRAYGYADHYRAKGAYVCLGGLHPTSLPEEAAGHADSVFCGPGEDTWPAFLRDFRAGRPKPLYRSAERTLAGMPPARRDLIKRERYLVPNSLVVSRGCPHLCDFCYKEAFFRGGKSFYVQAVDDALAEIDRLPGRHLYFLDDNLFGSPPFAEALFDGLRGMGRLWQAAGTVEAVLRPGLLEKAVDSGLRSLFVGFETLSEANLRGAGKTQNLAVGGLPPYDAAVRRLHDLGVMVNGAFVFGMDADDASVFPRTVEWAVSRGIETATFHIMTPYPGTRLERRLATEGRIASRDWDRYDTRHAVFRPARMTAQELESGYWGAYREFYSWRNIWRASFAHGDLREHARHLAYTSGWKKLEPMWDWAIRSGQVHRFLPLLEAILDRFGSGGGAMPARLAQRTRVCPTGPSEHAAPGRATPISA